MEKMMTDQPNEPVPSSEPAEDYAGDTAEDVVGPDAEVDPAAAVETELED
jgi:hypothetical protein